MKHSISIWDRLYNVIRVSIALIVLFTISLMFIEVIRRYCFGQQFTWSEELMRFMFIYVAYIGGAAAFKHGALVCFDLISSRFPIKIRNRINIFNNTIIIGFLAFMCYRGILTVMSPSINKQLSAGLNISMSIPYAAIPIGCFLMICFAIDNYKTLFARLKEEGDGTK